MQHRPVFCSIATRSHAELARQCLQSVGEHGPPADLVLFAVDGMGPAGDAIRVVPIERCIPGATLAAMRERYTVAELCFAAKPFLLGHLLESGASAAHYLDGDCLAFGSLEPLAAQLAQADVLLTPHTLTGIPDDGCTPHPLTVLRGGVFNGGYLGVRNTPEGRRFAQWLGGLTARYARNAPDEGMCGDQRWLDLVPALFAGAAICRHPGANVAYWNLHERPLVRAPGGGWQVGGQPLLFFHFSGYRADRPTQLSVHQDRHPVQPGSALEQLLAEYRQRLPAAPPASGWRRLLRPS